MVAQEKQHLFSQVMSDAIATATQVATLANKVVTQRVRPGVVRFVEPGTETLGKIVTPIAEHPLTQYAAKVPGISLLVAALGQVDLQQAQKDIDKLKQDYPFDTYEQLAHRIMVDTALKGGRLGLLTNFIPPLALALFGVELAAVTALQAEMVYRIAAAYGFSLQEPTRRGEVLAIFGLSVGGSGILKGGLSFVEILPLIGAAVGASSNAALIYSLGFVASQFYEEKRNSIAKVRESPVL